eukprot:325880-Chlamydomonas_euryale.AAC.5
MALCLDATWLLHAVTCMRELKGAVACMHGCILSACISTVIACMRDVLPSPSPHPPFTSLPPHPPPPPLFLTPARPACLPDALALIMRTPACMPSHCPPCPGAAAGPQRPRAQGILAAAGPAAGVQAAASRPSPYRPHRGCVALACVHHHQGQRHPHVPRRDQARTHACAACTCAGTFFASLLARLLACLCTCMRREFVAVALGLSGGVHVHGFSSWGRQQDVAMRVSDA